MLRSRVFYKRILIPPFISQRQLMMIEEIFSMKSTVGETLRKCRIAAGKSVREMSELLTANGFKASEKTIYSWENGNSQPTPDALLVMCRAYGVEDVLGTFWLRTWRNQPPLPLILTVMNLHLNRLRRLRLCRLYQVR